MKSKSKSKNKSESGRRAQLHFAREWIPMIGACTFAHPLNLSSVLQFCWSLIIDRKWKWKWKWKWKRWLALAQPLNLSADTPALQFCWCKWLAKVWLSLKGRNTRTQRILGSLVQYLYTRPPVWDTLLLYLERCPMTGSPDPWLLSTYYPTNFFQIRQGPCQCKYYPIALFSSINLFLSSTIGADPVKPRCGVNLSFFRH